MTASIAEIVRRIEATNGQFFTVEFVKRGDGSIRKMICRLGVKRHLKDGKAAYNFAEKSLIPVWDAIKEDYRSIPVEGIKRIALDHEILEVV